MSETSPRGFWKTVRTLTAAAVASLALAACAFALDGTVDTAILNVRSETSVKSDIVGKVHNGDKLEILSRFGNWYEIEHDGSRGFVFVDYVDFDEDLYVEISYGVVTTESESSSVNLRTQPSMDGERITRLMSGTKVRVLGYTDGWYYVRYADSLGYMSADYLKVNGIVYGTSTENDPNALDPDITEDLPNSSRYATIDETINPENYVAAVIAPPSAEAVATEVAVISESLESTASTEAAQLLEYAMKFIGTPYHYGKASPEEGFDCSGFTQYVFAHFGYSLNRSSAAQIKNGSNVAFIGDGGLQPGDLVFFSRAGYAVGHVGIYIGDGKFIHAPHTGDYVKISEMSESYYAARYVGARRVLGM
jgi:cell wall-associated NlpC family hydrolase